MAHRTMRSLFRAVEFAHGKGLRTEIIVVMDKPDRATLDYFSTYRNTEIRVVNVDYGDLGLSRNHGVNIAAAKYVATLDADDLFSETWLHKAFHYLENVGGEVVAHPHYHVVFEMENHVWRQISSVERDVLSLLEYNNWSSVCIANKEIFTRFPYGPSGEGFGYEDWHFNCETLAGGIEHHVVPETVHFLRKKRNGSLLVLSVTESRVVRPTRLFDSAFLDNKSIGGNSSSDQNAKQRLLPSRPLYHLLRHFKKPLVSLKKRLERRYPHFTPAIKAVTEGTRQHLTAIEPLPQWLLDEWRAINAIEPQLFPSKDLVRYMRVYTVPESRLAAPWLELCRLWSGKGGHLFLVPWLQRGGADLAAIRYIETVAATKPNWQITVISDLDADSPWRELLPHGVRFIEFGKICRNLTEEEKENLLVRLLLQMAPEVVHNINSDCGYRVFVRFGKALQSISRLFCCSFCDDMTVEGKMDGYPSRYLPDCFDVMQGVFCDCRFFANTLHKRFSFDHEKLFVHYLPLPNEKITFTLPASKRYLDILWAGRLDRQKRPDILAEIAAASLELPVKFHVYGASLLDSDVYTADLEKLDNVICSGPYNGFHTLPLTNFDLFLYTSEWDGLPNVLLEAVAAGLPIIAANVGGVGEIIINNETGFLIDPFYDVKAFVECIDRVVSDRSNLKQLVANAQALLVRRHSREKFIENLLSVPGYLAD